MNNKLQKILRSNVFFIIIAIFIGLLAGGISMILAGFNPFEAYKAMFEGVFASPRSIGWTIVQSTPIILTGLGIAFAFNSGMFNIGAEGQYIMGTVITMIIGTSISLPKPIQIPVLIVAALAVGAFYGGFAGLLKAKFGIHEVITTIMLNWLAFYFNNFIANSNTFAKVNSLASIAINNESRITLFPETGRQLPGFLGKFFSAPVHGGFLIAILACILVYVLLKKTTYGYEFKAVGLNPAATEYAGIDINKTMISSMAISGAISALAGAVQVMGYSYHISRLGAMENFGFDGIAVALLAMNNPIGVIFSGLFFGGLNYSGGNIQRVLSAPTEMIDIVIGSIILFSAMPLLFRVLRSKFKRNKG